MFNCTVFNRCTLKGSRIKGSRFIVSRLSFSLDSRDGFLSPGRYEICPGRFDSHDCTPNNRDAMNKLCTHTTYHKGTLVYTHNVLAYLPKQFPQIRSYLRGQVPENKFIFTGMVPANKFLFAGSVPVNRFLFSERFQQIISSIF